jgi:hypothetical protein
VDHGLIADSGSLPTLMDLLDRADYVIRLTNAARVQGELFGSGIEEEALSDAHHTSQW